MKKVIVSAFAALIIYAPSVFAGGIPVFDASNLTQSITNSMQQIAKMVEQIQQLQRQYQQMQQQYAAMTGGRGLGSIMNNPALREYLPTDWRKVYDDIRTGGYAGLTSQAQNIRNTNKIYDVCASNTDPVSKKICEREASKAAQDQAFGIEAYDKAKNRVDQIEALMQQVNTSPDQKAVLELNARLQAENALIQNEMIKMLMYKMLSDTEEKLIQQQKREDFVKNGKDWSSPFKNIQPVQYSWPGNK